MSAPHPAASAHDAGADSDEVGVAGPRRRVRRGARVSAPHPAASAHDAAADSDEVVAWPAHVAAFVAALG